MPYIPPHLRPNYKSNISKVVILKPKRRGVHFKSDISGLRTHDEKWHRYTIKNNNENKPLRKPISLSKKLAIRKLRKTPIKSILKHKKTRTTRKILSADKQKAKRKHRTIKTT